MSFMKLTLALSVSVTDVYEDDSQIDELHIYRMPAVKGGRIVVRIKPSILLFGRAPEQIGIPTGPPM